MNEADYDIDDYHVIRYNQSNIKDCIYEIKESVFDKLNIDCNEEYDKILLEVDIFIDSIIEKLDNYHAINDEDYDSDDESVNFDNEDD